MAGCKEADPFRFDIVLKKKLHSMIIICQTFSINNSVDIPSQSLGPSNDKNRKLKEKLQN